MSKSWHDDPVVAVFKVGPEAYMEDLITNGHVYMNAAAFFALCDSTDARHDPAEGAAFCKPATGATLSMQTDGHFVPIGTLAGPVLLSSDELKAANVYCLHARRWSSYDAVFDLSTLRMGEAAVVFLDFNQLPCASDKRCRTARASSRVRPGRLRRPLNLQRPHGPLPEVLAAFGARGASDCDPPRRRHRPVTAFRESRGHRDKDSIHGALEARTEGPAAAVRSESPHLAWESWSVHWTS